MEARYEVSYASASASFMDRRNIEDRFRKTAIFRERARVEERFRGILADFRSFAREHWQYLSLAIAFGIVIINSWQTYLSQVIAFGASGVADIIAAILFGFGSQTVLTQGVGLAKKWAEYRVKPGT